MSVRSTALAAGKRLSLSGSTRKLPPASGIKFVIGGSYSDSAPEGATPTPVAEAGAPGDMAAVGGGLSTTPVAEDTESGGIVIRSP